MVFRTLELELQKGVLFWLFCKQLRAAFPVARCLRGPSLPAAAEAEAV